MILWILGEIFVGFLLDLVSNFGETVKLQA